MISVIVIIIYAVNIYPKNIQNKCTGRTGKTEDMVLYKNVQLYYYSISADTVHY